MEYNVKALYNNNYVELITEDTQNKLEKLTTGLGHEDGEFLFYPHWLNKNYLINMGNKVKSSKKKAKEEDLIILRYKIQDIDIREAESGEGLRYILELKDSINNLVRHSSSYNEEEHNDKIDFYKKHDIYLWDLKRQKKDYEEVLNMKIILGINLSIDNEVVIESNKEITHILNINLDSDFSNGLIFNYNEKELKQILTSLDKRVPV